MKSTWNTARAAVLALTATAMLVVLGCRDAGPVQPLPVAAVSGQNGALLDALTGTLQKTVGLLSCKERPEAWAAAVIGKDGGRIVIGDHSLTVPKGALTSPVTITAHAPKGSYALIQFEPSGLVFAKPASLTMSYSNCDTLGSLLAKRIAYVDGGLNILYFLPSIDDLRAQTVTGSVAHFSDYAMSW